MKTLLKLVASTAFVIGISFTFWQYTHAKEVRVECDGAGGGGRVRCPSASDISTKVCIIIWNDIPVVGTYNRKGRSCNIDVPIAGNPDPNPSG